MASWNLPSSSSSHLIDEEPVILDNVDDFSTDDELDNIIEDDNNDDGHIAQSSAQVFPELIQGMQFQSKEETILAIKHYHITNGYKYTVVESKPNIYVIRCLEYHNGCQWRLRAVYSKVRKYWEIKNIDGQHSCFSTILSQDHTNLDSTHIATIISNSILTNPSILVKSLIADIKGRFGYSVSYRKAWIAKQKALAMEFGDWEDSYNHMPRWLHAVKEANPGTIFQCTGSPVNIDGDTDDNCYIMERVFWSFGPCIEGFKYCKPILQVDGTFLTGKYHGTLLTAIGQDGNRNIFPLAFVIVEGETKEALIWFFQLLREHICHQQNICIITDRGKGILSALRSDEVGWEHDGLNSVYCIRHLASNFNTKFKNHDLKKQFINLAYEVKQPTVTAKLAALRNQYPQQVQWIDKIPLQKWSQAFDGGRRYGHMTTNLAECTNSILKGARSLPICALIRTTFERTQSWFVERGLKANSMIQAGHQYPEQIADIIRKNQQQSAYCHVHRYNLENSEFDVQEISTPHHYRPVPLSYKVSLNEWWCDCGHFQATRLPCHHVIAVCAFSHIPLTQVIDPVYSLHNIFKAYQVQFHPIQNEDYWSLYTGPNFIPDPKMRRKASGRPSTNRLHNEMDQSNPDKPRKCSYCRNEGHHRGNCPFRQ
ncbi:uncharacterized protein LOC124846045 [Vigna umbellata]|uniref:uncharacterized protein LOC124846045 n=1 Tax=Vigna umbellata TaxID=87088 RepID=UPI001F5E9209|nr:uncharacterized protein LOC124846045 [Vigna umbellata]